MTATAPSQATSNNASTSNISSLAAPKMDASNVDMAPEKGFFKAVWSKVVDVYTSTFKSDAHIDTLQKMPTHELEIIKAVGSWKNYSDNVDPSIRTSVKTVSEAIGSIVEESAKGFAGAMSKLNQAYVDITGYKASELTPARREELSTTQRVKLSNVYAELKSELASGKTPYNTGAQTINEISDAMTSLVQTDQIMLDAPNITARIYAYPFSHTSPALSTRQTVNLNDPAIQAVAPGVEEKLQTLYKTERESAFAALADSDGVKTNDPVKIKDAISDAKTGIAAALDTVTSVVSKTVETAAHIRDNQAVRDGLLKNTVPTDSQKTVAYVSEKTLTALTTWFNAKTATAEADINNAFSGAQTKDDLSAWCDKATTFGVTTEQYRATLKAVGQALTPFTPLIDDSNAPRIFHTTIAKVKEMVEAAAISFVESLSHEEAMKKLDELKSISSRINQNANEASASGGGLTANDAKEIKARIKLEIDTLTKGSSKSW